MYLGSFEVVHFLGIDIIYWQNMHVCTWMMTGGVWKLVLPLSILAVALVQSCLLSLGVLLLPSLVPASPGQTGAPLLDLGHVAQLLLAELVHLGTGLGHDTLTNGTPVGLECLGQHSKQRNKVG